MNCLGATTKMQQPPRFLAAGDKAITVELGDRIDPQINRKVRDLALRLGRQSLPGIVEIVPTYRSFLVYYEPLQLSPARLQEEVIALFGAPEDSSLPSPRIVWIPTVYGGAEGPDLPDVATHNGLTPEEVVSIHAGTDYLVYMMGFSPGFPYLGGMSERIAAPRLPAPRTAIPAGSVGIAQQQTGIYPVESPGGWRLIGRTPVPLFDPRRDPPVAVEPGDYVRFIPIRRAAFEEIARQVAEGRYRFKVEERQ
jgi:inhibitor of KinA